MKQRNGFVSNSSSSSFLIVHHEELKTPEQVEKLLPECVETFRYRCWDSGDWANPKFILLTRNELATAIHEKLSPLTLEEAFIFHESEGYETHRNKKPTTRELIDFLNRYREFGKIEQQDIDHFGSEEAVIEAFGKHYLFYQAGASDDCGSFGAAMEHDFLPSLAREVYSHH